VKRSAIFDEICRWEIRRIWDESLPLAAWLMTNPSKADGEIDDPTMLRTVHFSRKLGAGGLIGVNVIPYRATDPADMLRALRQGLISPEILSLNLDYIAQASREASFHLVAFGVLAPELGWHRQRALEQFSRRAASLMCLGTSPAGWPLHPLARGKFAIRNDVEPRRWERPE
jgi:hypothetical protein